MLSTIARKEKLKELFDKYECYEVYVDSDFDLSNVHATFYILSSKRLKLHELYKELLDVFPEGATLYQSHEYDTIAVQDKDVLIYSGRWHSADTT